MVDHLAKADPAGAEFPRRGPSRPPPTRLHDDDTRSHAAQHPIRILAEAYGLAVDE